MRFLRVPFLSFLPAVLLISPSLADGPSATDITLGAARYILSRGFPMSTDTCASSVDVHHVRKIATIEYSAYAQQITATVTMTAKEVIPQNSFAAGMCTYDGTSGATSYNPGDTIVGTVHLLCQKGEPTWVCSMQ